MKYQFPVISPHAYSPSLAPSPPCNVDYYYRLPDAGDIYALCICTFRPALRTTLPADAPASPIKPGGPHKTRQDKTTLLGARGATPAFPSRPASHRSLFIQTACVHRFREKNETLTKKCNPHKKNKKKRRTPELCWS